MKPTPNDRFTPPGILRPCSAGGHIPLRLHTARLAHCTGGPTFIALIAFPKKELRDPINSRVTGSSSVER
jgi:hypothetical protein